MPGLETARLWLRPLTPEAVEALAARDGARLSARLSARFDLPLEPPPLTGDSLPALRDMLLAGVGWCWFAVRKDTGEATTQVGLMRVPEAPGTGFLGWSSWPRQQRQGFATEAVGAVLAHALGPLGLTLVEATIPPDNAPSLAVAVRCGMVEAGRQQDPEVGEVLRLVRAR